MKVLRIVARYDRADVLYDDRGKVKKVYARQYFTKYGFIPSPDGGFYDIGFGEILYPINESINTTLNQLIDAGHLSNTGGGFIGGNLRMKAGAMRFKPGEYKIINNFGGSIRDNIYEFMRKEPSPTLFQLLGLLIESGKEVASIKDVLSGDMPINAPATTTLAMIEQGLSAFKAIYKRLHRALRQELKKLFKINYMFLNEEEYKRILDDPEANIMDFASEDVDVTPVSDPAAVNDMERLAKAQVLMDFKDDPYIDPMEARRRVLEAAGVDNIDEILKEPPPPPMPQPDPLVEAQLALTQEQIESLRHNRDIKSMQSQADLIKQESELTRTEADVLQKTAVAIDKIAEAEGRELGNQYEEYKQKLANSKELYRGGTEQRTIRGVETPPRQQGAYAVPERLPPGSQG